LHFTKQSSLIEARRPVAAIVAVAACICATGCSAFVQIPGSALARAAHAGDVTEVRRLISAGAKPNDYDASSQTPLHWAARGGHQPGPHQCGGEDPARTEVVKTLLDLGADINALDRRAPIPGASSGWTPLHIALHHEQFAIAALLLQRGADARIRSHQGISALMMAEAEGAPTDLLVSIVAKGR
jgi:ankyrin repeat protein